MLTYSVQKLFNIDINTCQKIVQIGSTSLLYKAIPTVLSPRGLWWAYPPKHCSKVPQTDM